MRRIAALVVAVSLAAAATLVGCSRKTAAQTSAAPMSTAAGAPRTPAQTKDLHPAASSDIQAAADGLKALADAMPAELTDVDALAGTLTTPQAAFAFVRDRVALEPYAGSEKGAAGALLTRGGNDLDRALLLHALLKGQGVDAKVVHGTLRGDQAQQLFDQIAAAPDALHQEAASLKGVARPSLSSVTPNAQAAAIDQKINGRAADLQHTIDTQYTWLSAQLKSATLPNAGDPAPALAALQDHYWVVATVDDKATALDPSFAAAQPGQSFGASDREVDPDEVPDAVTDTVTFRLIAEYLDGGALSPITTLTVAAKAADLLGKDIRFSLLPNASLAKATSFLPRLAIGDDTTEGDRVGIRRGAGESTEDKGSAGGLGGGLGGAFGGGAAPEPAKKASPVGPPLARLTLQLTWHTPHRPDETQTRVILDRVGGEGSHVQILPAFTDDDSVRLPLMQVWDGTASAGPLAMPFVMQVDASEMDATAAAAKAFEAAGPRGHVKAADLPSRQVPATVLRVLQSSDYERAIIARDLNVPCRAYYTGPRIAFMRRGFEQADVTGATAKSRYRESLDILNSPFRFVCRRGTNAAPLALKSGVADTALELYARARVASINTIPLIARAGTSAVVVATQVSGLPAQVTAAPPVLNVLRGALGRGGVVVGLNGFVADGTARSYAWWEVGPNGCAIGRANLGGGQGTVEYGLTEEQQAEVTKIIAQVMGNFIECMFESATKVAVKWAMTEDVEKANDQAGDQLDDSAEDCMKGALCEAVLDLAFDRLADGLLERSVENAVEELDQTIFFLGQKKGLLLKAPGKGCEEIFG